MHHIGRAIQHPPTELPVLEWWARDYDHVFAVYNPFFIVPGHHPDTTHYGPARINVASAEELSALAEAPPIPENPAPEEFPDLIKQSGSPLRWEAVRQAIGAGDRALFDRTVWLWALNIERDDTDDEMRAALTRYCTAHGIYPPEEDCLPAILEPMLGDYLEALGIDEVMLWDEYRENALPAPREALERDEVAVWLDGATGNSVRAVSAPGFLISWAFDDVHGVLALTDDLYRRCAPNRFLECRAYGVGGYVDVFNPTEFLDRLPRTGTH